MTSVGMLCVIAWSIVPKDETVFSNLTEGDWQGGVNVAFSINKSCIMHVDLNTEMIYDRTFPLENYEYEANWGGMFTFNIAADGTPTVTGTPMMQNLTGKTSGITFTLYSFNANKINPNAYYCALDVYFDFIASVDSLDIISMTTSGGASFTPPNIATVSADYKIEWKNQPQGVNLGGHASFVFAIE